eukprot:s234_g42.t1
MGDDGDDADDYDDGFGDEHTQESEDEYGFEEDDPSRKNSRASNTAAAAAAAVAVKRDDTGGRGSRGSSQDFEPDEDATNGPGDEDAFEDEQNEEDHREHSFHMDDEGSRASSREFQEPDLPWADDPPPTEAQHGPSETDVRQLSFDMDDNGSRASSREFEEPNLPWADDPPPTVQFGGEEVERDPSGAEFNPPDEDEESELPSRPPTQEIRNNGPDPASRAAKDKLAADEPADDLQRAEALYRQMLAWRGGADRFEAGNYEGGQKLFKKSGTYRSGEDTTWLSQSVKPGDGHMGMEEDAWRAAMDKLAAAHESAGDVERAESLYLRMLAWREGADQFQAGNYEVGQILFKKSSTYRSVEDATWFLHNVKPDDGHMGIEAAGGGVVDVSRFYDFAVRQARHVSAVQATPLALRWFHWQRVQSQRKGAADKMARKNMAMAVLQGPKALATAWFDYFRQVLSSRHQAEGADAAAQSREIWTDRLDRTKVLRLCGRWFQRQHQLRLAEHLQQRLKDIPSAAGEWSLLSIVWHHWRLSCASTFKRRKDRQRRWTHLFGASLLAQGEVSVQLCLQGWYQEAVKGSCLRRAWDTLCTDRSLALTMELLMKTWQAWTYAMAKGRAFRVMDEAILLRDDGLELCARVAQRRRRPDRPGPFWPFGGSGQADAVLRGELSTHCRSLL